MFQIIKERVYMGTRVREGLHWNSHPGALFVRSSSSVATNFPFPHLASGPEETHFTAVIYTQSMPSTTTAYISHNGPLFKLVANVAASQSVDKVRHITLLTILLSGFKNDILPFSDLDLLDVGP